MARTAEQRWLEDIVVPNGMAQGRAYQAGDYGRCQDLADALASAIAFADGQHSGRTEGQAWCLVALAAYPVEVMARGL